MRARTHRARARAHLHCTRYWVGAGPAAGGCHSTRAVVLVKLVTRTWVTGCAPRAGAVGGGAAAADETRPTTHFPARRLGGRQSTAGRQKGAAEFGGGWRGGG